MMNQKLIARFLEQILFGYACSKFLQVIGVYIISWGTIMMCVHHVFKYDMLSNLKEKIIEM